MSIDPVLLTFIIATGVAVLLFELSMLRTVFGNEEARNNKLKNRLEKIKQSAKQTVGQSLLDNSTQEKNTFFYKLFNQLPFFYHLPVLIEQTGQKISLNRFLLISSILSLIAGAVTWFFTQNLLFASAALMAGPAIPLTMLLINRHKRQDLFDSQLPEALDIMTRALKAGHPFDRTLKLVADELSDPIAEEFAITYAELSYGIALKDALTNMLKRCPSKMLKIMTTSVLVQKETGGNLAEILQNISKVIRGSYRFQRKLKTLSAEGRLSMVILSAIPIVLSAAMFVVAPDIISELFTNPRGHDLLKISAVSFIIGFIWVNKLIKIEV